jgi:hypothetical protein
MLLYLHEVRGIPLAVAGIASAVAAVAALAASPLAAGVCLLGAAGAYRLESRLPTEAAITPA